MRRIFSALLITVVLAFASCKTTEIVVNKTNVQKLNSSSVPSLSGIDYALPKTVLDVNVVAQKVITKPGPFAEYANRYLGVTNVPNREQTEWTIKEIKLSSHSERDAEQVYRVESEGVSIAGLVQLDQRGVIRGVNMPMNIGQPSDDKSYHQIQSRLADLPKYSDLSIRKNTEPMVDTIFRVVRTDTSFTRLPVLKSQVSQKTLMNQAEEAANLIMKLRKRRFYLLTGEYAFRPDVRTPMPEGEALEVIVRELAQLEYDYVSLFVGRTITETETFQFSYTPDGKGEAEANDLFVFSKFRGILPAGNSNGDPVRIELNRISDPSAIYSNPGSSVADQGKNKVELTKGLAYRIPAQTQVTLILNSETIINKSLLIAQYGMIQYLPVHYMGKSDIMIRFHEELGSLDGIYFK